MKITKWVVLPLIAGLMVGCASKSRDAQQKLRTLVSTNKAQEASALVKDVDFLPEKRDALLRLVEVGTTEYLAGNYYQALKAFDDAKELSDRLFTESISKKVASAVVNDNADNYYGEKYERSMIRFYQSLCHYSLFVRGSYEAYSVIEKDDKGKITAKKEIPVKTLNDNEKRFHLTASKNILLEWDSTLSTMREASGGKVTYKDDLLAKLYGAFIHEQLGTTVDIQIAKDLYKAAKGLLFKNYNIYQTYNAKFLEFRKNFSKFENMDLKEVENNFTKPTVHYTDLVKYIDARLEKLNKNQKDNLFVLIESGLVAEKIAKKFDFPIPVASITIPAVSGVKDPVSFVQYILKAAQDSLPKIYFELPEIPFAPINPNEKRELVIKDLSGKEVASNVLVVVNPMSDIANQALDEESTSIAVKTGTRLVTKHISALGSSYLAYVAAVKKGLPEGLALAGAAASYAGLNKGIQASEQADLRSWMTLPNEYRISSFKLPVGTYQVFVKRNGQESESLGKLEITNESVTQMVNFRSL